MATRLILLMKGLVIIVAELESSHQSHAAIRETPICTIHVMLGKPNLGRKMGPIIKSVKYFVWLDKITKHDATNKE